MKMVKFGMFGMLSFTNQIENGVVEGCLFNYKIYKVYNL